jgi:hypothetical protein
MKNSLYQSIPNNCPIQLKICGMVYTVIAGYHEKERSRSGPNTAIWYPYKLRENNDRRQFHLFTLYKAFTEISIMSSINIYFDELPDGSHKCKECDKVGTDKVYKPKTATTNLSYHLNTKHHIILKPSQVDTFSEPMTEKAKAEITKAFIMWVVDDLQPFTTCERDSFIEFVQRLNPRYTIPSRKTLRANIFKHYQSEKLSIKMLLEDLPGAVGLTTDLWTSLAQDSYCGVTVHFLTDEWQLKHLVLDVRPMPYPHTGEAIKEALMAIIIEFGIEKKVLTLTTDNASSMNKAFDLLAAEMLEDHKRTIYHIRCGAHILNLAVQYGLKNMFVTSGTSSTSGTSGTSGTAERPRRKPKTTAESLTAITNTNPEATTIENPVDKLRLCVNAIRRSTKLIEELRELCGISNEKYHEPANDCPTRWSSTFTMINTALGQKKAMMMLMANSDATHVRDAVNASDWAAFESALPTFAIFAKATKIFSLQNYANIYTVDEVFSGIIKFLDRQQADVQKAMAAKLQHYLEMLPNECWVAEILDPNRKIINNDPLAAQKKELFQRHAEIYAASCQTSLDNVKLPPLTPRKQKKTLLDEFRELIAELEPEPAISKIDVNSEILSYLAGSKAGGNVDPCAWWKTNEGEYPTLALMARDWLAIPASSVPCEQLFSLAGNTVTKNRNCLNPETAQVLLCLKSWWAYGGTFEMEN